MRWEWSKCTSVDKYPLVGTGAEIAYFLIILAVVLAPYATVLRMPRKQKQNTCLKSRIIQRICNTAGRRLRTRWFGSMSATYRKCPEPFGGEFTL